jgi:hypothetical protein
MTEVKKRRGRPRKVDVSKVDDAVPVVDWEQLAKRLQASLESSIEENKVLFNDNCKLVADNRSLMSVVSYLESRLARANDSI